MEEEVLAYFQQYHLHTISRYTTINKFTQKIDQTKLIPFLETYQVDLTGFDYCTWFGGKDKERQALTTSHFIEVIKCKKWFNPISNNAGLEEQIYDFFQCHYFYPVTPGTTINGDMNFAYWDLLINDALEYFRKEFHVSFDDLKYDLYFGEYRENTPPITVQHMVEVAKCKKWFTPSYLADSLTVDRENELWLMGYIENHIWRTVSPETIVNKHYHTFYIPRYLVNFLETDLQVDLTGFDYDTWFVKGSWWRRILLFEKKRRPLTVSHLIEVVKRKKWFDPI